MVLVQSSSLLPQDTVVARKDVPEAMKPIGTAVVRLVDATTRATGDTVMVRIYWISMHNSLNMHFHRWNQSAKMPNPVRMPGSSTRSGYVEGHAQSW